jgi:hypothetical protein
MAITKEESRELVRRAMDLVMRRGAEYRDGLSMIYRENGLKITLRFDAPGDSDDGLSIVVFEPAHRRVFSIKAPDHRGTRTLPDLVRADTDAARVLRILREITLLDDLSKI